MIQAHFRTTIYYFLHIQNILFPMNTRWRTNSCLRKCTLQLCLEAALLSRRAGQLWLHIFSSCIDTVHVESFCADVGLCLSAWKKYFPNCQLFATEKHFFFSKYLYWNLVYYFCEKSTIQAGYNEWLKILQLQPVKFPFNHWSPVHPQLCTTAG